MLATPVKSPLLDEQRYPRLEEEVGGSGRIMYTMI